MEQDARGELEEALQMLGKKKPVEGLPVISKPSQRFVLTENIEAEDDDEHVPSIDALLAQVESDELAQLEQEDRAAMLSKSDTREPVSGIGLSAREVDLSEASFVPVSERDEGDEDVSGLPVVSAMSRPSAASKPFLPEPTEQAIIAVPSLDEILGRIDADELAGTDDIPGQASSSSHGLTHDELEAIKPRIEAETRLREAAQVHPDRMGSFETFVKPTARLDHTLGARDKLEAAFKEVENDIGWDFAADVTRRKPDPKGPWDPAKGAVAEDSDEEEDEQEHWPEASSSALGDMLRAMQPKPSKQSKALNKQKAALEKMPPSQRTEALPGVRTLGAKKPVAKPGPKSAPLKKGGALDRRLRLANAGGSLDALFEEKGLAEEEGEAPDHECILGGRPLRCNFLPQAFSCVADCQRDDWKQFT